MYSCTSIQFLPHESQEIKDIEYENNLNNHYFKEYIQ